MIVGLFLSGLIGLSLGLLGGGGSILTLPILLYVFHLETHQAIAGSLFVVGTTSLLAAIGHARQGHVSYKTGLLFSLGGMSGAYLGGRLGLLLPGNLLMLLFLGMMVVTAASMLRPKKDSGEVIAKQANPLALLGDGFVVGGFTGMVGAGGGFLVVPALLFFAKLPMRAAIGTSLMVIALKSYAGLLGYLEQTTVPWDVLLAVTGAAVVGSFGGRHLSSHLPPERLRKGFAYFVLLMALLVSYRQYLA